METNVRELLHVKEAARELGVTPTSVRRAIHTGELRALRLGEHGRYRIRRHDLEQFLTETGPRP
jgi:excisionase family DNA binding protein